MSDARLNAIVPPLGDRSAPARFVQGLTMPFRGLGFLLVRPRLWVYLALPTLISGGLVVSAIWASLMATPRVVDWMWAMPQGGLLLPIWYLTVALTAVLLVGLTTLFVYLLSGLIGTPFWDRLSQEVERICVGHEDEPFDWRRFAVDVRQSILHSAASIAMWVACMSVLVVLSFVPVVGTAVEFALSVVVTAFFLGRETMDGAMSRRRMTFMRKVRTLFANKAVVQGHGVVTSLLLWIPLLNFLLMPISVIGGTLLFMRLEADGLVPKD